ncbi:MAG: alcohol dehydrogenase catalytic domain-containing protein, partial [Pseudomonadota bacterium]
MKIEAALFGRSDGPELVTAELAPPRAHEVRVRLAATGICHTDVKAMAPGGLVPHPVVLGHEGAGYVDALGAGVTSLSEGDAVVLSFAHCGACPSCDDAAPAYCHHSAALNFGCEGAAPIAVEGAHVHGGFFGQSSFATYANVDARHAIKLAPDMPLARMAPLGCGVQTGAGAILNVLKPEAGARVVVFGAGSVGLSAVMAAALTPAQMIIAVDRNAGRLETAKEIGATH